MSISQLPTTQWMSDFENYMLHLLDIRFEIDVPY